MWRLNHVHYFHGSGILLLRNPFLAIRSSWNHFTTESLTDAVLEEDLILVLVEAVLVWPSLLLPPSEPAPLCLLPSEC